MSAITKAWAVVSNGRPITFPVKPGSPKLAVAIYTARSTAEKYRLLGRSEKIRRVSITVMDR